MPNTLVLVAEFRAKPGHEDALHDALVAMIAPSEAEPGCLGYRPLTDPVTPGSMVCLEEWVDDAALEFHFQTRTSRASPRPSTRSSRPPSPCAA